MNLPRSLPNIDILSKLPSLEKLKTVDLKSFGYGLAGVCALYGLILLYVLLSSQSTIKTLENRLASQTALITTAKPHIPSAGEAQTQTIKNHLSDVMIEGLTEDSPSGPLPIVRTKDGLTSFRTYQMPFDLQKAGNKPLISFVVNDFGLSKETSMQALETLPPEVGFILSPYSTMPEEWIKLAREKGHEIWISTPIENQSLTNQNKDTGPATILNAASYTKNLSALHWVLSRGLGYIGVAAYTDKSVLDNEDLYKRYADEVYGRGLGYLELNPDADPFIGNQALSRNAPYIKSSLQVIHMTGDQSFAELESLAKKEQYAVAVIPNYPTTIKSLAAWIMKIGKIDYTIAPASAIYDVVAHNSPPANDDDMETLGDAHALQKEDLQAPDHNAVQR